MKQEREKDQALLQLFSRDERSPLPEKLNGQIMQKVYRVQRRREIRNLCIAGATSLLMLAGVFVALKYYLKFDFSVLLQGFTKKPDTLLLPDFLPVLFIGIIVCSLLWIDHRIRKRWLRT